MSILAFVSDQHSINRILEHLGLHPPERDRPRPAREILRVAEQGEGWGVLANSASDRARPMNEIPTLRPNTKPIGTLMLGWPATAAGVELPPTKWSPLTGSITQAGAPVGATSASSRCFSSHGYQLTAPHQARTRGPEAQGCASRARRSTSPRT